MLDWIVNTINSLGYWGIALLMFLENIIPPIPSEIVMPLAGFTATQGKLNYVWVVIAGMAGSVLGALPWYYLGKYMGEKRLKDWADKYGQWLTLSSEDIDKSQQWFDKHGNVVVFFGRLIPGIRTYISVPAGLNHMPLVAFLLYSAVGTTLWVALLAYAGLVLGQNYQLVEKFLGPASGIVVVVLLIGVGFWLMKRKKRDKKTN